MNRILFLLLLTFSFQLIQAQDSNKNKSKGKKIRANKQTDGYTFPLGNSDDSLFVTFSKGSEESQLCKDGPNSIWLGKSFADLHYSDIIITFSKPVTSVDFEMSHFNFDNTGYERIQDFILLNEELVDVTSSAKFSWKTGPGAGLDTSIFEGTVFNDKNHIITAANGNYGEGASGRLIISGSKPFSKITFSHKAVWGTPNGILINRNINFKLATINDLTIINQKDSIRLELTTDEISNLAVDSLINKNRLSLPQPNTIVYPESNQNKEVKLDNTKKETALITTENKSIVESTPVKNTAILTMEDPKPRKKALLKRIKSIGNSKGYTFLLCDQEDTIKVTFFKGSEDSQLSLAEGDKTVWLGEINLNGDYSDILITFSKPVTSVDILMRNFNNDNYGSEQVNNFSLIDEQLSDVSSTSNLSWDSGPSSATQFDVEKQIITATKGSFGPTASGRLSISNTKPFSYIIFTHKVNNGTPGGVLINLQYNCPTPPKEIVSQENQDPSEEITPQVIKEAIIDSIKSVKELQALKLDSIQQLDSIKQNVVVATIKPKKETVVAPVEKKIIVKSTPKKIPTKVPAKVIAKKAPAKPLTTNKTPVKPSTNKAPVKKALPVKSAPKKIVPQKGPIKKVSATQKPTVNNHVKKEIKKSYSKKPAIPNKEKKVVKKPAPKLPNTLSQIAKLQVGDKIKLERVFFKQSLPELLPESYLQLDTLVIILNQYPKLEIELQGFTDNVGNPKKNIILSEQRVIMVKKYLISKGIAPERLTQKGFGGSEPVTDNHSEEHRKLNRRVEFMITKK